MQRIVIALIFFLLISLLFTQLLGVSWSHKKVFTSCQPVSITYNSYDPYCLYVMKQQQTLTSKYIIFIGKEDDPSYGHQLNFPTAYVVSNEEFEKIEVQWTTEGIELITFYGTKLYIPK